MKFRRFSPTIRHLEEPLIEVGGNIAVPEPKMGWTLLGPLGDRDKIYNINLGLIGDYDSLEKTRNLIHRLNMKTYGKDKNFLHIDFPGLEDMRISFNMLWEAEIDSKMVKERIEKTGAFHDRITTVAKIIKEKIQILVGRDPQPDLLILAYPKVIDDYCIKGAIGRRGVPRKTTLERSIEKARSRNMTLDRWLGIQTPPKTFNPVDLRSLVKSYCMEYDIPIQILRPHTYEPYNPDRPRREDDATTFWNLAIAMFYKANNLPWRVKGLMEDTSYIGISFFRDRTDPSNVKTALAQFFSLDSEGFVFKGEKAKVDENNAAHVSKDDAIDIIQTAIKVYESNKGHKPRRLVVHKTSRFNEEEIEGFREGANEVSKLDLVAFGNRNLKMVRWGKEPPIRGSMVRLPDNSVLLYTFGYIPYLDVYPGPRVPSPLEILEHHGSTSIDNVCKEILALTKLNWNNAKFCIKAPITIGFARRVGNILRNIPPDAEIQNKFKYYM
ncbi:hypothetical protein ACFL0D_07325 [Thermoproteota archaeon]